ncbi:MAG: SBBP repeat-containing protein [bacterium]
MSKKIKYFLSFGLLVISVAVNAIDVSVDWTKTHNGSAINWDMGRGIVADSSGNVYVTGKEIVSGDSNIWVSLVEKLEEELKKLNQDSYSEM